MYKTEWCGHVSFSYSFPPLHLSVFHSETCAWSIEQDRSVYQSVPIHPDTTFYGCSKGPLFSHYAFLGCFPISFASRISPMLFLGVVLPRSSTLPCLASPLLHAHAPYLLPHVSHLGVDLEHFHSSHCSCWSLRHHHHPAKPEAQTQDQQHHGCLLLTITHNNKGRGTVHWFLSLWSLSLFPTLSFSLFLPLSFFFFFLVPIGLQEVLRVSAGWLPVIVVVLFWTPCSGFWLLMWKREMTVVWRQQHMTGWEEIDKG